MKTANLQMEGLLLALASVLDLLREKRVLTETEIAQALRVAEAAAAGDPDRPQELRAANVKAIAFPVRFLLAALERSPGTPLSFSEITRLVGRDGELPTGPPHHSPSRQAK